MERSRGIMRRSVFTFLQNYATFTSGAALLALPFSASVLISSLPPSSSTLSAINARLTTLFDAAGFPSSSDLFAILAQKLSQTIFTSVAALPFTLSFFLAAKAVVIRSLAGSKTPLQSVFASVLLTHACNSLLILAANATAFALLAFAFGAAGVSSPGAILFLSAVGAVAYSIVLANALVVCNLALVVSGAEGLGGCLATLKACVLIRGRTPTALSLAVPVNLGLAAVEALFQFRVVRNYRSGGKLEAVMVMEGVLIFYLYSIVLVLDTVVSFVFFRSCEEGLLEVSNGGQPQPQEEDEEALLSGDSCKVLA